MAHDGERIGAIIEGALSDNMVGANGRVLVFDIAHRHLALRGKEAIGPLSPAVRLELGGWSVESLNITMANLRTLEIGERNVAWAELLIGAATTPESSLPALERHEVRVRLESLDCITLIYTCLALARAADLESFVEELIRVRYAEADQRGVDNHPLEGNFFDFTCEALLMAAIDRGHLRDATTELAQTADDLVVLGTLLTSHAREARLDPLKLGVRPYFGEQRFSRAFLHAEALGRAAGPHLRRGDIILASKGADKPTLVHHCFIVTREPNATSYIHASFSGYFYNQTAYRELQADPARFAVHQCGVSKGALYAGDDYVLKAGERLMHPYLKDTDRPLEEAIAHTFGWALVLRPS